MLLLQVCVCIMCCCVQLRQHVQVHVCNGGACWSSSLYLLNGCDTVSGGVLWASECRGETRYCVHV